ncbi:MAG TPA: hypothetical protein VFS43_14040 [Polyangiaceae bacterium]|nr:hypothetical protein [Polyangiaceae bacterium]
MRLGGEAPGLAAAFWVAFHQRAPGYGAMMHLRQVFLDARRGGRAAAKVGAWVVRQIAAMVAFGPGEVRKSALYGLAVDYFEDQTDATYVFTRLVAQLPREAWGALLPVTGPVPWRDKAEFYGACAGEAALYGPLMEALEGSVHGLFGQADLREVGRLVAALPAAACSEKVRAALSGPIKIWVGEVRVAPRRTPPPWRDSFLVGVRVLSTLPGGNGGLKAGSELVARGEVVGVVRHVFVPDDPEIAWRRLQAPEVDAETKLVSLRIEGPKRSLSRLVGSEAELYLPGLRAYLRGQRGATRTPAAVTPPRGELERRLSFLQQVADDFGRRNRG